MKQALLDNLKNLRGWRVPRKLLAFAVDDYANVRVASTLAQSRLRKAGLDLSGRMDRYDALETRQDLEALYEVLDSVRDSRGQPALFTAYALSATPDFARIRQDGEHFYPEPVPETFTRLAADQPAAYEGAWALWQEGRDKGVIQPQFHGREHLNVDLFEHKLRSRDADLKANLLNDSLAALTRDPARPGIGFSHAFGLHECGELERHREILRDGLDLFEKVWGFRSVTFTPPAQQLHPTLYEVAESGGVLAIDKPLLCVRSMGDGTCRKEVNHSGRQKRQNHLTVVRNVVFEPGNTLVSDPVGRAVKQISAAFRWSRPAIVSSHRVNFCGHLDKHNREQGLAALGELLKRITQRWPDVEFVSVDKLINEMR
ncbi:hypothetical protein [Halomonas maura]|uniref:hypothetical protein n=1 Tax=Halomonas maura TaxID=117606 RepID=UPI0025B45AE7|nr:hypothetical protein [Halomonas maura]MDN3555224.1 hypothetical protein [Halomonas maura]